MVAMGLLDENIFESMRLILPEHRMLMKRIEREQMRQTQPVLSEDQYEEMQCIIEEAIENKIQVRMTLFGTYENKMIVGYPYAENGRLKLNTEDGIETVPLDKLVFVEIC
jgi:hypothetical protein